MARGRRDACVVDRHRTSAGISPRRDPGHPPRYAPRWSYSTSSIYRGWKLAHAVTIHFAPPPKKSPASSRPPTRSTFMDFRKKSRLFYLSRSRRPHRPGPSRRRAPRLHHRARPSLEAASKRGPRLRTSPNLRPRQPPPGPTETRQILRIALDSESYLA